jgi:2-hydroxychromene-2-carboxylate isomerase
MTPIEFYFDFTSPYGFLAAMPSVEARLVQENEGAIAEGVFGSPFFNVDGEPFWGSDRIPLILGR